MELRGGSVGSRSEEEEVIGKDARFVEIVGGMNGPSDVSGIGDLGSNAESVELETLERSADVDDNSGMNGSCADLISKILQSVDTNGEIVGIEQVAAASSKVVGSPSEISKGSADADSQLKSKEVEKVGNLGKMVKSDENKSDSNVSVVDGIGDLGRNLGLNGKVIKTKKALGTPSSANGSPSGDSGVSPTNKGYGLKKWRRIRRDLAKDLSGISDPNRNLKRGLSNPETVKTRSLFAENRQKSESSDALVNSAVKDMGFSALSVGLSDSESRLAVGTAFAIGADSENSEDHSSKSTAASAPKLRLEGALLAKEKSKVKNTKNAGNAGHKAQQGKGKVEASKKLRGDKVKVEKENSHSSVESDLRSSNAVFTEDAFARVAYGRQRDGPSNYDGENSDVVQSSEEVRADCYKENGEETEVVSRADVAGCLSKVEKNKESENQGPNVDQDPLAESAILLQAVQEALEKEIENFREIGKEPVSPLDSSSCGVSSSAQVPPEEIEEISSAPKETQFTELSLKGSLLEYELLVATEILKAKESKVLELETILKSSQLPKEETEYNPASFKEMCREMEIELEDLFKTKMEAEVEFLLMVGRNQKLEVVAQQMKILSKNHAQTVMKLRDAEDEAAVLKRLAEELDDSSRELLGAKDVLKMQNDVCKFTLCSFAQLILLCIAFAFFLLQLLPHSHGVVPT